MSELSPIGCHFQGCQLCWDLDACTLQCHHRARNQQQLPWAKKIQADNSVCLKMPERFMEKKQPKWSTMSKNISDLSSKFRAFRAFRLWSNEVHLCAASGAFQWSGASGQPVAPQQHHCNLIQRVSNPCDVNPGLINPWFKREATILGGHHHFYPAPPYHTKGLLVLGQHFAAAAASININPSFATRYFMRFGLIARCGKAKWNSLVTCWNFILP